MVVDFDGRILAQASPGPGREDRGRARRRHARCGTSGRRGAGHHMLAHLRTEAYPVYRGPVYPPAGAAGAALVRGATTPASTRRRRASRDSIPTRPARPCPLDHGVLVALALAGALARARDEAVAQAAGRAAPAGAAGSWVGWARLTNDGAGSAVPLRRGRRPPQVRLELARRELARRGRSRSTCPRRAGLGLPRAAQALLDRRGRARGPRAVLHRLGRQRVDAVAARGGAVLQGLLAWRQGGARAAARRGLLAPRRAAAARAPERRGAACGAARRRRTRRNRRQSRPGRAGGRECRGGAVQPAGEGRHAGHLALILGANVVGLGPALRRQQAGQGQLRERASSPARRASASSGPRSTSPASAKATSSRAPPAGPTESGAPQNAPCDGNGVPCEASLSCNSGLCEDRVGRCPY